MPPTFPWFQTDWLIRNELGRLRQLFFEEAFTRYARARLGLPLTADQTLDRLEGALLTNDEAAGVRAFAAVARQEPQPGGEKRQAAAIAERFEPLYVSLEKMWRSTSAAARKR